MHNGSGECGSRGELVAGHQRMLGFGRLDVILAIGTEGLGRSSIAVGLSILDVKRLRTQFARPGDGKGVPRMPETAGRIEDVLRAPAVESSGDPVIRQLWNAIAAVRSQNGRHTEICADAMRLAIVARLLSLQSEAKRSTGRESADGQEPVGRRTRGLQPWRLKRVVEYIDKHLSEKITLSELATVAGLSRMYFAARFRATKNLRPHEYILRRRIEHAQELLRRSTMSVVDIALAAGFQSQAHFTTVFKRFTGDTPRQWRNANGHHQAVTGPTICPRR